MLGLNHYLIKGQGSGGIIRQENSDFRVEEILPYEFNKQGDYTIIKIEKDGLSTLEARNIIANKLGIERQRVSYAGLKDKNAITRQYFSIHDIEECVLEGFKHEKIRILETHKHSRKIKIGKLYANRFCVIIRDCKPGIGIERFKMLQKKGVPNVIGWQRFGGRNGNTHIIGEQMIKNGMDNEVRKKEKGLKWLYVTAYQSKIFNEILNERMAIGLDLKEGDLKKHYYGMECSSGLFPGYKTPLAGGEQGRIETVIMDKNGIDLADFKKFKAVGKRRSNIIPIWDSVFKAGKDMLEIKFTIPKGCFATSVLREVMKKDVI